MLIVDAANVVGSRPDGWWRDRSGAAARLVDQVLTAVAEGRLTPPVVVVLEGQARRGVEPGERDGVTVVHAEGEGDDTIVAVAQRAVSDDSAASGSGPDGSGSGDAGEAEPPAVVTADRGLTARLHAVGVTDVRGPRWLLDRLDPR